jgi:hypothetical protein
MSIAHKSADKFLEYVIAMIHSDVVGIGVFSEITALSKGEVTVAGSVICRSVLNIGSERKPTYIVIFPLAHTYW